MTNTPEASLAVAEALKPCPFCGGEAKDNGHPRGIMGQIYCSSDDCFGPITTAGLKEDSVKQWNTRATPADTSAGERVQKETQTAKPTSSRTEASATETAGWQLIETAPRDGTWFLACATTKGWGATRIVRFRHKDDRLPTNGEGVMWPSPPTHWRLLPTLPDADTDARNRSESTPPAVLAAPQPPVEGLRELVRMARPKTGKDVLTNAYERGRYDGVKEYAENLMRAALASPSPAAVPIDGHGYTGPFTAKEFNERAFDHDKAARNGLAAGPNVSYVRTFQACAAALRFAAKHMFAAPAALIEQSGAALDLQGPGKMGSEDRSTHEA